MPARRKLTVRDLPALFVLFGALFGAISVGLPIAERMDMANERDLVRVSGHVDRIYVTNRPKAGRKLQITLRSSDRIYNLSQEDMSAVVPAIGLIKPGDKIDALVSPDKIGRDLEWIWVLTRDGNTIVSYQDTETFLQARQARTRWFIYVSGLLSVCLIAAGVEMRRRLGAWRVATK
jgi:hypothetical protein